jgi:hypothetical protein
MLSPLLASSVPGLPNAKLHVTAPLSKFLVAVSVTLGPPAMVCVFSATTVSAGDELPPPHAASTVHSTTADSHADPRDKKKTAAIRDIFIGSLE